MDYPKPVAMTEVGDFRTVICDDGSVWSLGLTMKDEDWQENKPVPNSKRAAEAR